MTVQLLFFGITQDLVGQHTLNMEIENPITLSAFKQQLLQQFPNLNRFPTFEIAINEHYVLDDVVLKDRDIIAIIPPVSGG